MGHLRPRARLAHESIWFTCFGVTDGGVLVDWRNVQPYEQACDLQRWVL